MKSMTVGQSKNGLSVYALEKSDTIKNVVLSADDLQTITVPADGYIIAFSASNNFYWSDETFTLPGSSSFEDSVAELNPGVRYVTPGETLYFRAIAADTRVTASFYKGVSE